MLSQENDVLLCCDRQKRHVNMRKQAHKEKVEICGLFGLPYCYDLPGRVRLCEVLTEERTFGQRLATALETLFRKRKVLSQVFKDFFFCLFYISGQISERQGLFKRKKKKKKNQRRKTRRPESTCLFSKSKPMSAESVSRVAISVIITKERKKQCNQFA